LFYTVVPVKHLQRHRNTRKSLQDQPVKTLYFTGSFAYVAKIQHKE